MGQLGFYINSDVCTGCKACELACKDRNNLDVGARLRRVRQVCGGGWTQDANTGAWSPENVFSLSVSFSCGHCDNPACVEKCPTGAMTKDEATGIVSNDLDVCIGCGTCPAGVPLRRAPGVRQGGRGPQVRYVPRPARCRRRAGLRGHLPSARPGGGRYRRLADDLWHGERHGAAAGLVADEPQHRHRRAPQCRARSEERAAPLPGGVGNECGAGFPPAGAASLDEGCVGVRCWLERSWR